MFVFMFLVFMVAIALEEADDSFFYTFVGLLTVACAPWGICCILCSLYPGGRHPLMSGHGNSEGYGVDKAARCPMTEESKANEETQKQSQEVNEKEESIEATLERKDDEDVCQIGEVMLSGSFNPNNVGDIKTNEKKRKVEHQRHETEQIEGERPSLKVVPVIPLEWKPLVERIQHMGYSADETRVALSACSGNLLEAVDFLLANATPAPTNDPQPSSSTDLLRASDATPKASEATNVKETFDQGHADVEREDPAINVEEKKTTRSKCTASEKAEKPQSDQAETGIGLKKTDTIMELVEMGFAEKDAVWAVGKSTGRLSDTIRMLVLKERAQVSP